ncbi:ARIF-1 [Chrysodeixis chalcites nucleopolyhedrovirus]|uniref:ARIF-1 n=1 Tax=Chrysodeixis chalcites nucleopolyhedrovirus TaxID=320432 RepID=Q4KST4_9ABAC|nr:ARIF-1 [Chrysodeixis chalcites nucleopolyhedrovirus]AGC36360.1 ARIF-1 protein [Chrysodeixis chalcites SNPV TF1-A]AAY84078.1 ARIF-1 [Chrysodeixis chalcites nucleopolyhedrovirus]AGE61406.1 ARIF-1 [Chrysodeixis chalcites nucleopolyhedrovirus]AGE61551.1 ARIF-1 [Chrysodeixis chalcites nucleopolyhedrovirus]AGE61707.1 ARIF-1 [Chrysodeixis chalcites nucleopolyhedrovirus]
MQAYLRYYTKVMLFACGFTAFVLGVVGINDGRFGLIIDYEDGSQVVNFSSVLLVYGLIVVLSTLVYDQIAVPLIGATTILTTIALFSMDWFVTYGHVPGLDVNERDYDIDKECWDGIVKMDNNAIQSANCFTLNNKFEIYCAKCRSEYYVGEPTFLKTKRFSIILFPTYVLLIHLSYLYVAYKTKSLDSKSTATSCCPTNKSTSTEDTIDEVEKIAIKPVNGVIKDENRREDKKKFYETQETYINFKEEDYDSFDGDDDSDKDEVKHYINVDKNESPYYAVPTNNTPKWDHAAYTYMAIPTTDRQSLTAAATAPPLSFLMSSK